jgi:hypothetical protein
MSGGQRRTALVVTGEVRLPDVFRAQAATAASLLGREISDALFVTWEDETERHRDVIDEVTETGFRTIALPRPPQGTRSGEAQRILVAAALAAVEPTAYVVKSRPDAVVEIALLLHLLTSSERDEPGPWGREVGLVPSRIWFPWFSVTEPFILEDIVFAGDHAALSVLSARHAPAEASPLVDWPIHHHHLLFHPALERIDGLVEWRRSFADVPAAPSARRLLRPLLVNDEARAAMLAMRRDAFVRMAGDDRYLRGLAIHLALCADVFRFDRPAGVAAPHLARFGPWVGIPGRHERVDELPLTIGDGHRDVLGDASLLRLLLDAPSSSPWVLGIRRLDPRSAREVPHRARPARVDVRLAKLLVTRLLTRSLQRVRVRAAVGQRLRR